MSLYLPSPVNLTRLPSYLRRFQTDQQPAAYEFLTAVAMHRLLDLPIHFASNADPSVAHRVVWHGSFDYSTGTFHPSPSGPDSTCFAYGFCVLVENTLRGNVANQWRREYVESIDHYDNFITTSGLDRKDVYLIFVAPEFHQSTFAGFRQKAIEGYGLILVESSFLGKLCQICQTLATYRHLDIKHLFNTMVRRYTTSTTLSGFRKDLKKCMSDWEGELLEQEKTVYFGLKSYEAMHAVGRPIVGSADIMLRLKRDRNFERYYRKLGGDLAQHIRRGLLEERLAKVIPTPHEDLFCCVDSSDFRSRAVRLIRAVERVQD